MVSTKLTAFVLLFGIAQWAWGLDTTISCGDTNPCDPETLPPVVVPPPSLPLAEGHFVDCAAGSDSNAGTTAAAPWLTLAKVAASTIATASDVWIKAGTECTPSTTFNMTWDGLSTDAAVLGGYVVISGVAYQNIPTNYTVSTYPSDYTYTVPRPIIRGSYHDSCRISAALNSGVGTKCAWNTADSNPDHKTAGTAIPTSTFAALVNVTITQYQTVQDLDVRDSAGRGIGANFPGTCLGGANCSNSNLIIQRNNIDLIAGGNAIITSGIARFIIRENQLSRSSAAVADTQPCTRNTGRCPSGASDPKTVSLRGGSAITPDNCNPCIGLIENNDIHDDFGEAIGAYDTSYVLVRGNRGGSNTVAGFDGGGSEQLVWEQNLIMGGLTSDTHISAGEWAGKTIFWGMAYENGGGGLVGGIPGKLWLVRNNLCSGATSTNCYNEYTNTNARSDTQVSSYFLGNTAITNNDGNSINLAFSAPQYLSATGVDVVDNLLIYNGAGTCASSPTSSLLRWHHNQHTITPPVNCRTPGTGDVVSTSHGISTAMSAFINASWTAKVTVANFVPSGGAGINVGTPYTTTILNSGTTWDFVLDNRRWLPPAPCVGTTQVPKAEWIKGLTTDFCGVARSATTPDVGAFEHN